MPRDKSREFRITYEADDGYVGRGRPLYVCVTEDDIEEGMDLSSFFDETVQDAFEQRVSPVSEDESAFVEWAQGVIEKRKEEEQS